MPDYVVTIGNAQYHVTAPSDDVVTQAGQRFDQWMATDYLRRAPQPTVNINVGGQQELGWVGLGQRPQVPNEGVTPEEDRQQGMVDAFGRFLSEETRAGRPTTEKISDWTRNVGNALTFGNFNEIVAGADNLLGDRDNMTFQERLTYEDQQDAMHRLENPLSSTAVDLAGGLATPAAMMRGGASFLSNARPTAGSVVPRSVLEGAGYGAVAGFGEGGGDFNVAERLRNTGAGALGGGVMGGIFGTVAGSLANRSAVASAPTREAVGAGTDAAYDAMRTAGVRFNANSFDNLIQTVDADLLGQNLASIPNSGAARWLGILQGRQGQAPTMDELDTLRSNLLSDIRDAQRGANPNANDVRLMERIVRHLDDYMTDPQAPLMAGNLAAGQAALAEGRTLSVAGRKSDVINEAVREAQVAAGERTATPASRQSALANAFRSIANDPARMRLFTLEERSLINEIAGGGLTENTLRGLGRLGLTNAFGGLAGFLPAAGGAGAAFAAGGPSAAAGAVLAGEIGSRLSGGMTRQNQALLDALARSSGQATANPAILPILQGVLATGAVQGIGATPVQDYLGVLMPPQRPRGVL